MDALDIAILRTMGVDPYARPPQGPDALKPGAIAKAIGVTPETVRERVQRMEASGLIAGYQAYPNLRHLGLEAGSYLFDLGDEHRRTRVVPALAPVDGILAVHSFMGPEVCVDLSFATPAERSRRLQVLSQLTGDANPTGFVDLVQPAVRRPLTNLDWRIVRALRGRARRSLVEVAEEVGVGYRTVKRHHDRLCGEGSLYLVPMLDPGKEAGLIPFWLLFFLRPDAPRDTPAMARERFGERQLQGMVPTHPRMGNFGFLLVAETPAQVEQFRRDAAAFPGVERASAMVPVDLRDCSGGIDDLIDARIRATGTAREEPA